MFDVWTIDFVSGEKRLWKAELSRKKAKRLAKRFNKEDPFSLAIVVPLGFCLC